MRLIFHDSRKLAAKVVAQVEVFIVGSDYGDGVGELPDYLLRFQVGHQQEEHDIVWDQDTWEPLSGWRDALAIRTAIKRLDAAEFPVVQVNQVGP